MQTRNKKTAGVLLIIAGLLCISYLFFGFAMGWGVYFGCAVIALSGVAMVIYGCYKLKGWKLPDKRVLKVFQFIFKTGLSLFIVSFVIVESLIISSALYNSCPKVDYLVVEGAALRGESPSLELYYRLRRAVQYLKLYPDTRVVVSGGQGPDEIITEAEAMRRYLVNYGVAEERIVKEEGSTSTFENLKFSKQLMDQANEGKTYTIGLVTNDFHVFRSKLLAGRLGLKAYGCPTLTPFYIIPNHYVREYFAVIKSVLVDK